MATTGTVRPDAKLVDIARKLFEEVGAKAGAERLGISMSAFMRVAAGGSVRAGTVALANAALKSGASRSDRGERRS